MQKIAVAFLAVATLLLVAGWSTKPASGSYHFVQQINTSPTFTVRFPASSQGIGTIPAGGATISPTHVKIYRFSGTSAITLTGYSDDFPSGTENIIIGAKNGLSYEYNGTGMDSLFIINAAGDDIQIEATI